MMQERNLLIGIYSRISHNLTVYKITGQEESYQKFLIEAAHVLVIYDLPDETRKYIIDKAMQQHRLELEHFERTGLIESFGGSAIKADVLLGFLCEELCDIMKEGNSHVNTL